MASHGELPISSHAHIRCLARLSLHRPTTLGSPAPENRNRATTHAHMLLRRPYPQCGNAALPVERHDAMSAMSERVGHEVPDRGADRGRQPSTRGRSRTSPSGPSPSTCGWWAREKARPVSKVRRWVRAGRVACELGGEVWKHER